MRDLILAAVPAPVLAANRERYGSNQCDFAVADILTGDLPQADIYF